MMPVVEVGQEHLPIGHVQLHAHALTTLGLVILPHIGLSIMAALPLIPCPNWVFDALGRRSNKKLAHLICQPAIRVIHVIASIIVPLGNTMSSGWNRIEPRLLKLFPYSYILNGPEDHSSTSSSTKEDQVKRPAFRSNPTAPCPSSACTARSCRRLPARVARA